MRWPATIALLLALTGCGVAADDAPRAYDEDETRRIGSELAPRAAEEPATELGDTVDLWFVDGDRLAAVTRTVEETDPAEVVEMVVAGPRPTEEVLGLRSAVTPTTTVLGVDVTGTVARVDLSRDFALLGGEEELLAVAQVVTTLVGLEGIDTVSFALDGEDIPVPDAEGVLRDRLTAQDVRGLVVQPGGG